MPSRRASSSSRAFADLTSVVDGDVNYTFLRGAPDPAHAVCDAVPARRTDSCELGLYAQDQWTIKRLTLNYGLRFDYFNG